MLPVSKMGGFYVVRWSKPVMGRFKINTDGCAKGNPGPGGGGVMVRNHLGDFTVALSDSYGTCSNMKAEALALCHGLQLSEERDILQVDIEIDSLILVQILTRRASCS